jgi:hypothetical protein
MKAVAQRLIKIMGEFIVFEMAGNADKGEIGGWSGG